MRSGHHQQKKVSTRVTGQPSLLILLKIVCFHLLNQAKTSFVMEYSVLHSVAKEATYQQDTSHLMETALQVKAAAYRLSIKMDIISLRILKEEIC